MFEPHEPVVMLMSAPGEDADGRYWSQERRERLGRYVVRHPILTAAWTTLVVAIGMTPVMFLLVAPEIRPAMSLVAVVTLAVCFAISAVAIRAVVKNASL